MKFIADLHIHSKYSRATSKDMDVENLDKWGRIKGIKVLGTGDFTHPAWIKELREKLEPAEQGLFKVKKSDTGTRFLLSSEISCIYSKNNRVRKIHIVVLAPDFLVVEKINTQLDRIGNIKSDGRPILGLDARELAKIVLNISSDCLVIPAHIWTPWFSLFGDKSGFDTIEECFEDYSKYIYAVETGLSSDPKMNWRLSALDNITLISNSDAHSAIKIGREANVLNTDLSYNGIAESIKNKSSKKFIETIEFFPQEGRYHYNGHRKCNSCLSPQESKKIKNICPVCGRPLTVGTCHRIDDLADRDYGIVQENSVPFKNLIPLNEIIAEVKGVGVRTKTVKKEYDNLINHFDSEFKILLEEKEEDIEQISCRKIAEGINRVRLGNVNIEPGYDGEYGKIKIF
ncbi:endonuclease Q family protein [Patescibacteria group bacterium]